MPARPIFGSTTLQRPLDTLARGFNKNMKDKDFGDRLSAAKNAKQAMTAKFLQRPGSDDPAVIERRQAREAVSAARAVREAQRNARAAAEAAETAAQQERADAEAAFAAAEAAAQQERAVAENEANKARLEVEQKAARDARYAARKARK
jgi:hypothetical protein